MFPEFIVMCDCVYQKHNSVKYKRYCAFCKKLFCNRTCSELKCKIDVADDKYVCKSCSDRNESLLISIINLRKL